MSIPSLTPSICATHFDYLNKFICSILLFPGSFGKVCKIKRKSDGKILVWKEMNYGQMSSKEKELVVSEVNILRDLKNPFIVKYYDRIVDREATKLYIVMELCTGGDLGKVVKKCKQVIKHYSYSANECMIDWFILTSLTYGTYTLHLGQDFS